MEIVLISGLVLGLTSSFHCLGMCGPIALVLPLNRKNNWTILAGTLQYSLGRIITYSLLGVLVGLIGVTINIFGVLQWISIVAGIALVIYAWKKQLLSWLPKSSGSFGFQIGVQKMMHVMVKSKSPFRLFTFGLINGMLPCGMVYVALMNAILVNDLAISPLAMTFFGIGTLPVMVAVPFFIHKLSKSARGKLNRAIPYLLTVVGLMIALRGMNLGIPFVSPKIQTNNSLSKAKSTAENSSPTSDMKMDCCHSADDSCEK